MRCLSSASCSVARRLEELAWQLRKVDSGSPRTVFRLPSLVGHTTSLFPVFLISPYQSEHLSFNIKILAQSFCFSSLKLDHSDEKYKHVHPAGPRTRESRSASAPLCLCNFALPSRFKSSSILRTYATTTKLIIIHHRPRCLAQSRITSTTADEALLKPQDSSVAPTSSDVTSWTG